MGSGGGGRLRSSGCHRPRQGKNRHEVLDAFILGFAQFQVGCSARFNDLQHVHPKDLIHTSSTVELKAWQTKTVSAARINRNPRPLIAPKYSFSRHQQWTSRTQVRRAARTKLKGKGKHPLRYPQGAHHRLDHGQWWNTNLGTHQ